MKLTASLILTLALAGTLPLASRAQSGLSEPLPKGDARQFRPGDNTLLDTRSAKPTPVPALAPPDAVVLLANGKATVLDVRTPAEFATGHLAGAKNIDFRAPNFAQQVAKLNPQATYLVYCKSGNRSSQAVGLMRQKGFRRATNVGGYEELKALGAK